jgi:hypothetical protein
MTSRPHTDWGQIKPSSRGQFSLTEPANRLAQMRSRLSELERISENSTDEAVVMATEEEAHEIMSSLENVRELRSSEDG